MSNYSFKRDKGLCDPELGIVRTTPAPELFGLINKKALAVAPSARNVQQTISSLHLRS